MSRILLLLVFLFWLSASAEPAAPLADGWGFDLALFFGGYALLVAGMAIWSRRLARRVATARYTRGLRRFHNGMLTARFLIPVWFAVGIYGLGWSAVVEHGLGAGAFGPVKLPGFLLGVLPPLLAWAGLWWSQYPAERTLREQHLLSQLEDGLPVHAPPTFREYFVANLRLQILFTSVPILLIVLTRDVLAWAVFGHYPMHGGRGDATSQDLSELLTFLAASGVVFLVAPEILRRVLKTSPFPDGPLRRRLEGICKRTGMNCRDILVWHTDYNVGNAAVMGLIPRVRYVLLSDLLLERMDDEQIEAVFAHEVGHVVHRHMVWFVVFFLILFFASVGPLTIASDWFDRLAFLRQAQQVAKPLGVAAGAGAFCLAFGFLSRRFERQADVYAARVMEAVRGGRGAAATPSPALVLRSSAPPVAPPPPAAADEPGSHVGPYGASLFASALHRVAVINNIPLSPRARRDGNVLQRVGYVLGAFLDLAHDWLHGSIPDRMAYLHGLSADPVLTSRFDRVMARLYCAMLFTLFASAAWTGMVLIQAR